MKYLVFALTLALSAAAFGCDSSSESCDLTGNNRLFGECCTSGEECESGVCHEYGDGALLCTETCEKAEECPEGSEGQKCNNKGVCKP